MPSTKAPCPFCTEGFDVTGSDGIRRKHRCDVCLGYGGVPRDIEALIVCESQNCGAEWARLGFAKWGSDGLSAEDVEWIEAALGRELTGGEMRVANTAAEAAFYATQAADNA